MPIVEAVIPMLEKVGIKVKIKPVEATVLAEVIRKGDYQAYIYSVNSGPDPQAALKCFHSATPVSACNYTTFKNAEVDKLLDEAGATDDPAKKIANLKKVDAIIYEEAPVWFFNYNKAVMAYQPWLKGLQPNATELAFQDYERPLGRRVLAGREVGGRTARPSMRSRLAPSACSAGVRPGIRCSLSSCGASCRPFRSSSRSRC